MTRGGRMLHIMRDSLARRFHGTRDSLFRRRHARYSCSTLSLRIERLAWSGQRGEKGGTCRRCGSQSSKLYAIRATISINPGQIIDYRGGFTARYRKNQLKFCPVDFDKARHRPCSRCRLSLRAHGTIWLRPKRRPDATRIKPHA